MLAQCFSFWYVLASTDDKIFKPFKFRMEEIEGFRYRAQDALRAVTKSSSKNSGSGLSRVGQHLSRPENVLYSYIQYICF